MMVFLSISMLYEYHWIDGYMIGSNNSLLLCVWHECTECGMVETYYYVIHLNIVVWSGITNGIAVFPFHIIHSYLYASLFCYNNRCNSIFHSTLMNMCLCFCSFFLPPALPLTFSHFLSPTTSHIASHIFNSLFTRICNSQQPFQTNHRHSFQCLGVICVRSALAANSIWTH